MEQGKMIFRNRPFVLALIMAGIFISALAFSTGKGGATAQESEVSAMVQNNGLNSENETTTVSLPIVLKNYPWVSPFGFETWRLFNGWQSSIATCIRFGYALGSFESKDLVERFATCRRWSN